MTPERLAAIAAVAQAALALVALIGTVAVSLFVYYGSRRIARAQYLRTVYDAWVSLDIFLLSHPDYLEVYNSLARPGGPAVGAEQTVRRHIALLTLNPLSSYYFGIQQGYIDKSSLLRLEEVLGRLLRDDDIYRQSQDEIFGAEFATLCKSVRERLTT